MNTCYLKSFKSIFDKQNLNDFTGFEKEMSTAVAALSAVAIISVESDSKFYPAFIFAKKSKKNTNYILTGVRIFKNDKVAFALNFYCFSDSIIIRRSDKIGEEWVETNETHTIKLKDIERIIQIIRNCLSENIPKNNTVEPSDLF